MIDIKIIPPDPVLPTVRVQPFAGKVLQLPYMGKPVELTGVQFEPREISMSEVGEDCIDPFGDPYKILTDKIACIARLGEMSETEAYRWFIEHVGR